MSDVAPPPRALVSAPLSYLPRPLLEPRRPALAIGTAWVLTLFPSIALAALVAVLFPGAPEPQFDVSGARALILLVVFAPVLETLIMGAALLILLRLSNPTVAVLVSALGWGLAHSFAAPTWGLVIWWPFLVFSTLFVVWRERSLLGAFAMPALAHALHNLPTAALIAGGVRV